MKIIKLFLLSLALVFIGQVHAGVWDELKPYVVTEETPIIFSPKDSTLVLEDLSVFKWFETDGLIS